MAHAWWRDRTSIIRDARFGSRSHRIAPTTDPFEVVWLRTRRRARRTTALAQACALRQRSAASSSGGRRRAFLSADHLVGHCCGMPACVHMATRAFELGRGVVLRCPFARCPSCHPLLGVPSHGNCTCWPCARHGLLRAASVFTGKWENGNVY